MFDGLFEIPVPEFLQVHDVILYKADHKWYVADDNGWPIAQEFDGGEPLRGYVCSPDPKLVGTTERIDAVLRGVQHSVPIEPGDWIRVVAQDNMIPALVGLYRVPASGVRPNAADLRILLTRPTDADERDAVNVNPIAEIPFESVVDV